MTETEWLAATDPYLMLRSIRGNVSERKERLFAVALTRRIWLQIRDERIREIILLVERYADGLENKERLAQAEAEAEAVWSEYTWGDSGLSNEEVDNLYTALCCADSDRKLVYSGDLHQIII